MTTDFFFMATQALWDSILIMGMGFILCYWIAFILMVFDPETEIHPDNDSTGAKLINFFHKKIHKKLDK